MNQLHISCNTFNHQPLPQNKTLKILAIGNSFSVDAMEHLWNICHMGGLETVVLGNLYIPGCSLQRHLENIEKNAPDYIYYKNTAGIWQKSPNISIHTALTEETWDIITLQQESGNSGVSSTYLCAKDIVAYINDHKTNPDAHIYWHMTWAYQRKCAHKAFGDYNYDQMIMYRAITDSVQSMLRKYRCFQGLIPVGTAIQNLRASYIGDILCRDGYHLTFDHGRFTAALTWFAALGGAVDEVAWVPADYSYLIHDLAVIRESVKNAIAAPLTVTPSRFTRK